VCQTLDRLPFIAKPGGGFFSPARFNWNSEVGAKLLAEFILNAVKGLSDNRFPVVA
jgi:hypothetical protein